MIQTYWLLVPLAPTNGRGGGERENKEIKGKEQMRMPTNIKFNTLYRSCAHGFMQFVLTINTEK